MKESEYKKLRAQIEAEYHRKLEALDMVWKMAGANSQAQNGTDSSGGHLTKKVRDFVSYHVGDFTVLDVEKHLRQTDPSIKRVSIATALRRMQVRGEVEVIKAGTGRAPSVYRKKQQFARKLEDVVKDPLS